MMDVNILFMVLLATLIPDTRDLSWPIRDQNEWHLPDIWDEAGCQDCQDTARARCHVRSTHETRVTRGIWVPCG